MLLMKYYDKNRNFNEMLINETFIVHTQTIYAFKPEAFIHGFNYLNKTLLRVEGNLFNEI